MKKMKKTYKSYWIDYYVDLCRMYNFHIGVLKYKLENRLELNRLEEDLLSELYKFDYIIRNMERSDCDDKED